jgi:hypothetical protein
MKNLIVSAMLIIALCFSFTSMAQTTTYERPDARIGWIGNVWHPLGIIVNYEFDDAWGIYGTVKSKFERHQAPMMNDWNYTGGISVRAFKKTSQLYIGFSYVTGADYESYNASHPQYDIGIELLLSSKFPDRNWNWYVGWSSNPVNWVEGATLGFAYQFVL